MRGIVERCQFVAVKTVTFSGQQVNNQNSRTNRE
jgi:hypothetical protein